MGTKVRRQGNPSRQVRTGRIARTPVLLDDPMTLLALIVHQPPIDDEILIVHHLETRNVIDIGNDGNDRRPATHLVDPPVHEVIPSLLSPWNVLIGHGISKMDIFISQGVAGLIKTIRRMGKPRVRRKVDFTLLIKSIYLMLLDSMDLDVYPSPFFLSFI